MKKIKIALYGLQGSAFFCGSMMHMPLKEEFIIKKSIEYFNDPAPCFIHRSAVTKRICVELEDFFTDSMKSGKFAWRWAEIPDNIQDLLVCDKEIEKLEVSIS